MKRRVLIAKALSHEPEVLFLDEPTAGVDVELRKDMWNVVEALREQGVTVILTTHYIEEAEQLADRVGVINNGEMILVEEKDKLMRELGKKQLALHLYDDLDAHSRRVLSALRPGARRGRRALTYTYDTQGEHTGITDLLNDLRDAGIRFNDLQTSQSSLEEIFVDLVNKQTMNFHAVKAIYRYRNGAHVSHRCAEHRRAGAVDVAVLRDLRLRRSARASPRSTASATAPSSCRA